MDNTSKIICRKCNGNHLTIKCGKTGASIIETTISEQERKPRFNKEQDNSERKTQFNKEGDNSERKPRFNKEGDNSERKPRFNKEGDNSERKPRFNKDDDSYKRTVNKVKITNLPTDMTEEELNELLYEWGTVKHLRLLNYENSSTAYVEFRYPDEVDYFVKALDKTPFEYIMLNVEKIDQ
jgi:RNA recognition motif-containing protein